MAKYTGKPVVVENNAAAIAEKFSDLTRLQAVVDQLPEDQLAQVGDLAFEKDAIAIGTKQLGTVKFVITERTPSIVKFESVGTPLKLGIDVTFDSKGENLTEVGTAVDVDIPLMLRPMIAPQMHKMVDMLSEVMGKIAAK